jgi:hypothetical protein
MLLHFDYDSMTKHIYSVYPLPAYAVAALWMGLGVAWLADRFALGVARTAALGAILIAAIFAWGIRSDQLADEEWLARYARAVLKVLPENAVVLALGDPDLAPIGYFHMIEGQRPDIVLYSPKGLVLGNRLFNPMTTPDEEQKRLVQEMIDKQSGPVVTTLSAFSLGAVIERWLYAESDPSSDDPKQVTVDIPEEAVRFFEEDVAEVKSSNAWLAFIQGELRHRYAVLLARSLPRGAPIDARTRRQLDVLGKDFYGAIGLAEGFMVSKEGYPVGVAAGYLDKARELMPSDALKVYLARYFQLRGGLRAPQNDPGALEDFETALSIWPSPSNPVIEALEEYHRDKGDSEALSVLEERVKKFKQPRH